MLEMGKPCRHLLLVRQIIPNEIPHFTAPQQSPCINVVSPLLLSETRW